MSIESVIIANLMYDGDYAQRVVPFIKPDYFDDNAQRNVVKLILTYVEKYNEPPTKEALEILTDKLRNVNEKQFDEIKETVSKLEPDLMTNREWLLKETEDFCRTKDLHASLRLAIDIIDGNHKEYDTGAIPKLLQDSLSITFDNSVGHDYIDNAEDRWKSYTSTEERVPFDIEIFNKITDGGLGKGSLTIFLAITGGGKSIMLGHIAAAAYLFGLNVLYISMELSEKELGKRLDANMLNTPIGELKKLPFDTYIKRVGRVKDKTPGRLKVVQYPTSSAHVGHFRYLLKDLKTKQDFTPDIILVDYINICASSRVKPANVNSYTLVKNIAEEIRGLAVEYNVPIVSATQLNKQGYGNSDVDLTNTSESMGLVHTVDAAFAMITDDELAASNRVLIKQLKNRWGDTNYYNKFIVGMDKSKMRIFNVEESAQKDIINSMPADKKEDTPVMDAGQGIGLGLGKSGKSKFFNVQT